MKRAVYRLLVVAAILYFAIAAYGHVTHNRHVIECDKLGGVLLLRGTPDEQCLSNDNRPTTAEGEKNA